MIAQVVLAGVLVTWAGTDEPLGRDVFGRGGSVGVLVAAMALIGVGASLVLVRPARPVLLVGAVGVGVAVGGLAVLAFAALSAATGLLLLLACGMAVPVLLGVTRTRSRAQDRTAGG
ncbi:hypothetical protein BJP25_00895 [Actinokineospora bangkokensis]|uniref:Uncharacterized protein n=1 Tax=Actinokineospora bangkokensis TaxID=1193682 RepID=A0A1Q9LHC8_9PSEU|nr:hypothetical protein BJP25_00895 [Actinokineospora bangkokensis]